MATGDVTVSVFNASDSAGIKAGLEALDIAANDKVTVHVEKGLAYYTIIEG
jgi:hypothetical protein